MWEKKETYPFGQTGRPAVTSRSVSPSYFCLQTGSWPHSRPCRGTWTSFTSRHPLSSPSNRLACLRVSGGFHLGLNNERCLAGLNFTVTSRASFNALLECMISIHKLSCMDCVYGCLCVCVNALLECMISNRMLSCMDMCVCVCVCVNALLECMISNCMLSYMDIVCVCTCVCTHYFVVCSGFTVSDFNNHATCGF